MIRRKQIIAITMAAALTASVLPAVMSTGSYATDSTTGASAPWNPTPAPAPAPAPKPAPAPAPKPTTTTTTTTTAPKPVATTTAPVSGTNILRLLVEGSFGEDVKLLQTWLNNFSYTLRVDGFFGKLTAGAVRDFQGKNGLVVDGMVGPKTLAKLAPAAPATPVTEEKTVGPAVDTVATASIVNNNADFVKAIGKDGFWLAATLKDLTFTTPLVLEGNFVNDNGAEARKIALYTQDANRNVIDNFTLKAPKLTILSPSARLQNGSFVGDLYVDAAKFEVRTAKVVGNIYVSATGFKLTGATVEGNVYYTTQAAKDGAVIDAKSKVSGEVVLMEPDVVTTASTVDTVDALIKGISTEGKWITNIIRDLKTDKELVVAGEFAKTPPTLSRKLSLYSQITNEDKTKTTTRRFTLTAPKLTVESPNFDLSNGIFNGDIYVNATGFKMTNQVVNGNIYFMTQKAKDTFAPNAASVVNGQKILIDVDVVTTASLVDTASAFEAAISKDGVWLVATVRDIIINKPLVLEGDFKNGEVVDRKIALYTQDDKRVMTRHFTLMAPRLTVKSPNARLQGGIFDTNVYVESANVRLMSTVVDGDVFVSGLNFSLTNAKVTGTIVFMNAEAASTFKADDKSVYKTATMAQ
jgi:hypothetical protein